MSRESRRKGRGSRRRGWGSRGRWRPPRWWGRGWNCPTRGRGRRGWRNRLQKRMRNGSMVTMTAILKAAR